jgi:hypothetical protein
VAAYEQERPAELEGGVRRGLWMGVV